MSLPRFLRLYVLAALTAPLLWGCDSDAAPAEATGEAVPVAPGQELAAIPREELYGASPAENLWTPRVELDVPDLPAGWSGARIAIVSDLQLGLWEGNEAVATAAIQRAIEMQPTIIALLGDFLAEGGDGAALQRVLAPLRGQRTVAVLGDRDIRSDSTEVLVTRILAGAGVQVLRNNAVGFEQQGDTVWIAGLDPNLAVESIGEQEYVLAVLGVPGRTPILLTHLPILAARAPVGRFPVAIAGHTFCGSVDVPGTPRLSTLQGVTFANTLVEGTDRLFRIRGSTVLVTCGVGYGFLPLRFGAAPEVALLALRRLDRSQPQGPGVVADTLIERFQGTTQLADSVPNP